MGLQLQSTSSTTPPSEPTHLSFSKPHDQEHPNLHQQPNRPNQAQTNDRNAAPHHPPPPLNRKTQLPPYHHRHNNNNPPLLPLPPQPSPQRHPRQRLPQARTKRILQIRQRRRRSRDRKSSLRPFLNTPRRRTKHRWEGEWWRCQPPRSLTRKPRHQQGQVGERGRDWKPCAGTGDEESGECFC